MASSALGTIVEMFGAILNGIASTTGKLFGLAAELLRNLSPISQSGPVGFVFSAVVLFLIVFFVGKYIFKSGKSFILISGVGLVLLFALVSSVV